MIRRSSPLPRAAVPRPLARALAPLLLAAAAAGQGLLPEEKAAFADVARGRRDAAAASLVALAERTAAAPSADAVAAGRVEAWVGLALSLHGERRADPGLPRRVAALRGSAAARAFPLLADRLGMLLFEDSIGAGDPSAAQLGHELGCLDRFWIQGPFDNERGAGFQRAFPPEEGLDLEAAVPGKQRPVAWRLLPTAGHGARFPLASVLEPHEQSLCYAATALVATAACDAVLELGSTGSFRAFCNGRLAGERDVERQFAYDQDAIALRLAAGPNLLLLKLCHQEGDEFEFAARLRAPNGEPLQGVAASVEPEALRAAAKVLAVEGDAPAAPHLGGRTALAANEADPAEAFRLALLWSRRAADGDLQPRDRAFAQRAAAALAGEPAVHVLLAALRTQVRRSEADRDENERRRDFEQALAIDPQHAGALTGLGALLLDSANLREPAEDLAHRALAAAPGDPRAIVLHSRALQAAGQRGLAAAEVLAAAGAEAPSAELLRAAVRAHFELGEPEKAFALQVRLCARSGAPEDHLALAHQHLRAGRPAEAKGAAEALLVAHPFTRGAHELLAELHEAHGRHDEALKAWAQWLETCPEDAGALLAQSRLHGLLGDAEKRIEALRLALEIDPNLRDERRLLEYLAAEATPFHQAHAVDGAALLADDPGPPADASAAKDPVHWVLRQRVVRAHRNGTTSEYVHHVVRVLTDEGARALSSWRLPHWHGEQSARLLACTVRKADGRVEKPNFRGSSVSLPSLRPGDVLDVAGRIDDTAPTFFGDYFGLVHRFASGDGAPVRRAQLVVLADPGREYRWQTVHGAPEPERTTLADGTLQFRWELRDLPRDDPEPQRPGPQEREPFVRMTTYRDWDHFASWWWNLIEKQLEVTPAMKAKVQELTAELASVDERIAAIYRFVTTDVRYEAWEFGVHGYKPYSTAVVFERRHGDCKDKALLLSAMLGEIGVRCSPVLIFADPLRSRDDLTLAMVQQFNHCIAWLPPQDGRPGRFLDGTATLHPTDVVPEMDQGARVLVVDRGKAELATVPWTAPEANAEHEELAVDLRPDGGALVTIARTPTGNLGVELRTALAAEPARRREQFERELQRSFGKTELATVEASDPLRLGEPVRLKLIADVKEVGQRAGERWLVPSTWQLRDLQQLANEPQRDTPLLLGAPWRQQQTLRFRPPPGWAAVELPAAVAKEEPFGAFTMEWRAAGEHVVVERTLALTKDRVEPKEYAAFRAFVAAVKAADARLVVLQKEDGR